MNVALPVRKDKASRSTQDGNSGLQIEVRHYDNVGDEEQVYRMPFADYLAPLHHAKAASGSK